MEIPRKYFMQGWAQKRTEIVRTYEKQKILRIRRGGRKTRKNYIEKRS